MQRQTVIIEIDDISCPKVNFLTFTLNGTPINHSFLRLKKNEFNNGNPYHLDASDLRRLNKQHPTVYSHTGSFSRNHWEDSIIYALFKLISGGIFNKTIEKDSISYEIVLVWVGPPKTKPSGAGGKREN